MSARPPRPILAALAALATCGCEAPSPAPWLVNETPSLPRGVYRLSDGPLAPGAIVALRAPRASERYLRGLGAPRDALLLKRVAAVAGEDVCRRGAWTTWPGGAVRALRTDRRGVRLPAWGGCRRLAPGELLVLGDAALSFDSRYFGPVTADLVHGVYREAWRW